MKYRIIAMTEGSITIWDMETRDKNGKAAGTMTIFCETEGHYVDQIVRLAVVIIEGDNT